MMGDTRRAVERAFPLGLRLVVLFEEAGVRIGARIEQSRSRLEKTLGAIWLDPQKFGEAEVRQRVPFARAAFDGGVCRIFRKEPRHRLVIAEQRGGVDIATRDAGMRGQDLPRAVERAVPYRHVDKLGPGILGRGLVFRHWSIIIARAPTRRAN